MFTKTHAKKQLRALLAPFGFRADGNHFRRDIGTVKQALYLQPSRYGHHYYPEMLITFGDLSPARRNTQQDSHVRIRLSSCYHPDGDPRLTPRQEWFVRYDIDDADADVQLAQLREAMPAMLAWFETYPTWQRAAELMHQRFHATWSDKYNLFEDLGQPVPRPA
jgi:hypothetical protein